MRPLLISKSNLFPTQKILQRPRTRPADQPLHVIFNQLLDAAQRLHLYFELTNQLIIW